MVSTYLTYTQINRDMKTSLSRIAADKTISNDQAYYNANIGNVKTVDDLMDDYRLYSYAMKAHGLEDMTYAKAFMKKVLESDLSDTNSYANKLTDDRYRNFASAFNFTESTKVVQTETQETATIGLYSQSVAAKDESYAEETAYYSSAIDTVTNVDQFLSNSRLRNYVLDTLGLDKTYISNDHLKKVLTSDVNDPDSYVNQLPETYQDPADSTKTLNYPKSTYLELVKAFNFQADGTLADGTTAQTATQKKSMTDSYTFNVPGHTTAEAAELNKTYMETALASVTKASDITDDSRLFTTIKTALGLPSTMLKSTFQFIITSDLSDPSNYATTEGGSDYEAVTRLFNFQGKETDEAITAGTAVSSDQLASLKSKYSTTYDDTFTASREKEDSYYKTNIGNVTTVKELFADKTLYNYVLNAYGIDPATVSKDKIEKVLTSDMSSSKSYANMLADKRFAAMAKAFNFDTDGNSKPPLLAQSEAEILKISKEYVVQKTSFGNDDKSDAAKAEASYYSSQVSKITTVKELLADSRLVNFMLEAKGIDPKEVTTDYLKQIFSSDLSDPDSFANTEQDTRFRDLAASFNFDSSGKLADMDSATVQSRRSIIETNDMYLQQNLEEETGNDSEGARLALYFERKVSSLNTAYDVLADSALVQVFRTAYSLPDSFSNLDLDKQAEFVDKNLDLEKLREPDELKKFMARFTSLYDLAQDTSTNSTVSLLSGSNSGISAETLLTLAQLRSA
jgi:Protein of unknown function (DUF1217)